MKIVSRESILDSCKWINPNLLLFDIYSDILNMSFSTELHFNSQQEEKVIRNETIESIIEFQKLSEPDIEEIQNAMWDFVVKYKSESEREYMGIRSKSAAIAKSKIVGVGFINEDELNHTFFNIFLSVEWDIEHGITISYYNGKFDDVT